MPRKRAATTATAKHPTPAKKRATGTTGTQLIRSQVANSLPNAHPPAPYEIGAEIPAQRSPDPMTPLATRNPIPSPSTLGKKTMLETPLPTSSDTTIIAPSPRKRGRPAKSRAPSKNTIIDLTSTFRTVGTASSPTDKTSSSSDHYNSGSSGASKSAAARLPPNEGTTSSSEIKQEDRTNGLPTKYRRQTRSYTKMRKMTETEDGVAETNASLWDGGVITYGGGERHLKFR